MGAEWFDKGCVPADHTDNPVGAPWEAKHDELLPDVLLTYLKNLKPNALITEQQYVSDTMRAQLPYVGHSDRGFEPREDEGRSSTRGGRKSGNKILSKDNRYPNVYIRRFDLAKEQEMSGHALM